MKKKDIAKKHFGVEPQTLRNWIRGGVPSCRVESVGNILMKRAQLQGCKIQQTPHQIKCGIKKPGYFATCLKLAFPGISI
jgi:uncharacterized protein YjcR